MTRMLQYVSVNSSISDISAFRKSVTSCKARQNIFISILKKKVIFDQVFPDFMGPNSNGLLVTSNFGTLKQILLQTQLNTVKF